MHTRRCQGTRAVLLSLLGIALAGPAAACQILGPAITLAELIAGEPFQVGDKRFENFSYLGTGDMPDASLINVVPIQDGENFGIRIQGGFTDLLSSPGGSDALIGFTVSALGGLISGVNLAGNPALIGDLGHISVVENFPDLAGDPLTIFAVAGIGQQTRDSTQFDPRHELQVIKDIAALFERDGEEGGVGTLSYIDQTFTQVVPEPGTAALLCLGLAVLSRRWSRRRR